MTQDLVKHFILHRYVELGANRIAELELHSGVTHWSVVHPDFACGRNEAWVCLLRELVWLYYWHSQSPDLTCLELCYYNNRMARPLKDAADRKTADLRIPMTIAQKQTVADAMAINGREMAGWARTLILSEAEKLLATKAEALQLSGAKRKKYT